MNKQSPQTLQTAKEAGARLGVSEVTIFRLFDAGELQGVILRRGTRKRTIRFTEDAIERFIAARATGAR